MRKLVQKEKEKSGDKYDYALFASRQYCLLSFQLPSKRRASSKQFTVQLIQKSCLLTQQKKANIYFPWQF